MVRSTFRKHAPTRSRHLEVQLCKSVVESNGVFSFLFNKIFNEPGTNPRVDGFEKVRNLGSREFNILRLEYLLRDKIEAWCCLWDMPTRRAHLKTDVLVLLENPSSIFEDMVYVFLAQFLEVRHSRLEPFANVALVLAETECRAKEHTGLRPSTGGRC